MQNKLVWIDLEMTGLDPQVDTILEIATIITDMNLNIIAHGPNIIIHQPDEILDVMNDWCKKNHQASGLTDAVKNSTTSLEQAEQQTLDFIHQHTERRCAFLAGNSIWQDRLFIQKYMPRILEHLHYRMVDVTSIKELLEGWHNIKHPYTKNSAHRALDDIQESINELAFYRKHFFVDCPVLPEPQTPATPTSPDEQ